LTDPVLDIKGLSKRFGDLKAVDDLTLRIGAGEFFTLLGPNGAGKTTTIKLVTGLLVPDAGTIKIAGHDLRQEPDAARQALGYIPDRPFFYEKLTGREYLDLIADLYELENARRRPLERELTELFTIACRIDEPIESYSQGMRQKLAFCGCFLHGPRIAVIDEPWVGLDPRSIRTVTAFLRKKCEEGTTIFMSTHTLSLAQKLSHRTGIIHRGTLMAIGGVEEILADKPGADLEEAFLAITREEEEIEVGKTE